MWDGPDGPVTLFGTAVTPSLFPLLRAMPQLGRLFTEAEAVEGAHQVVLLSHGAWTRRFASDPDVIGAPIVLDDEPHTVLGVLPDGFESSFYGTEFWTPLVVPPYEPETIVDGSLVIMSAFTGVGRLRDGVSPARAETEVRTILERGSERPRPTSFDFETRVMSLREERGRPFRPALLMLAAATGLVLLMACANVAGLLLAHGIVRQRELAVKGALGAGRGRIVRQLLTESVVLGVAGGAAGLAVAVGIVRAAPALMPRNVPGLAEVGVDGAMLAFTAAVSVVAGLLFGTAPALAWSRVDLARTLSEAGASAGGFGRSPSRAAPRRPIGVRMALGAGRGQVVRLVVGQGGALVAAGVVLGVVAAATASRIVESVLLGVTPADPLTFTAVTAVLVGVALLACWLPARRATRIDPMNVLREA